MTVRTMKDQKIQYKGVRSVRIISPVCESVEQRLAGDELGHAAYLCI